MHGFGGNPALMLVLVFMAVLLSIKSGNMGKEANQLISTIFSLNLTALLYPVPVQQRLNTSLMLVGRLARR
jgi:hypothetical protein